MKADLLGAGFTKFSTVDSLEIVRALPKYSPDGTPINSWFVVVLKAKGYSELDNKDIEKQIEHTLIYRDGKWNILGTNR